MLTWRQHFSQIRKNWKNLRRIDLQFGAIKASPVPPNGVSDFAHNPFLWYIRDSGSSWIQIQKLIIPVSKIANNHANNFSYLNNAYQRTVAIELRIDAN